MDDTDVMDKGKEMGYTIDQLISAPSYLEIHSPTNGKIEYSLRILEPGVRYVWLGADCRYYEQKKLNIRNIGDGESGTEIGIPEVVDERRAYYILLERRAVESTLRQCMSKLQINSASYEALSNERNRALWDINFIERHVPAVLELEVE